MNTPRYFVAKYIPDLRRMEPRNVGVVVWSPEGVAARFLAERADRPGEVDGRSVPSFVNSPGAYKQWVRYWRKQLDKPSIRPVTGGRPVSQTDPGFLDALSAGSKGNFLLVDAGFLLDPLAADDLPKLTDSLFDLLVDPGTATDEPRDPTLDELCDQLIQETGLASDPHFRSRHPVACQIAPGLVESFEFSHAYQNGALQRLYHRVPLSRQRKTLRKTVHDSAWMFEKVIADDLITRDQTAALVYVPAEQRNDQSVRHSLLVLESTTRILNLDDYDAVREEFEDLAALATH